MAHLPVRLLCSVWSFLPSVREICRCRAVCIAWRIPRHSAPLDRLLEKRYASDWPFAGERDRVDFGRVLQTDTWLERHAARWRTQCRLTNGNAQTTTLLLSLPDLRPRSVYGPKGGRYFILRLFPRLVVIDTVGAEFKSHGPGLLPSKEEVADLTAHDVMARTGFRVLDVAADMLFTTFDEDVPAARGLLGPGRFVDQWTLPTLRHTRRYAAPAGHRLHEVAAAGGERSRSSSSTGLLLWTVSDTEPDANLFSVYNARDGNLIATFSLRRLLPYRCDGLMDGDICAALLACVLAENLKQQSPAPDAARDLPRAAQHLIEIFHRGCSFVRVVAAAGKLVFARRDAVEVWSPCTGRRESTLQIDCDPRDRRVPDVCAVALGGEGGGSAGGEQDALVVYTCGCDTHRGKLFRLWLDGKTAVLQPLSTVTLGTTREEVVCLTPWSIYTNVSEEEAVQGVHVLSF